MPRFTSRDKRKDALCDRVNGYLDARRTVRNSLDPLERETAAAWLDSFYGRRNKILAEQVFERMRRL